MQNKINDLLKELAQQDHSPITLDDAETNAAMIYNTDLQEFIEKFCESLNNQYNNTLEYLLICTPGTFTLPCDLEKLKISCEDDLLEGTRKILFTTTASTGYKAFMSFERIEETGYDKLTSILDFMVRERYPEVTKFADVLYFGPKIQLIEIMTCLKYIMGEEFGWESATDFCFTDPNAEHELHAHTNLIFTLSPESLAYEIQGEDTNSGNLFWATDNGLSFLDMCGTKQTELINWTKAN